MEDLYFLQLTDNPNFWIHQKGKNAFQALRGLDGAAMFTRLDAETFIRESKSSNLRIVHINKVLELIEKLKK